MPATRPDISLVPLDLNALDELAAEPESYARAHQISLGSHAELLRHVAAQSRTFAVRAGALPPWGGFLTLDRRTHTVVGTCSYKGPPDAEGAVEIAYLTFPEHEGHGYATAMADALRKRAADADTVRVVRAHTAPERNASVHLLEKLGFHHTGQVIDAEDGPIWRWEWNPRSQPVAAL